MHSNQPSREKFLVEWSCRRGFQSWKFPLPDSSSAEYPLRVVTTLTCHTDVPAVVEGHLHPTIHLLFEPLER